ncbi:MAG: ABC transporter ATP-binding protein [Cyanobacteria bacterium REEB67]|nr:ABC transporter ATP-binding protein [Cyanobacteria bacterium REEB67]
MLSGSSARAAGETPAIVAQGLTRRFAERVSVDNLSLSIYPGELYALLGDNGAGKTTTINMLTTLLAPSSGDFQICGHSGVKNAEKIKEYFGIVSQDVSLYNELTCYENLKFLADLYRLPKATVVPRIEELLIAAGMLDRANDRAGNLSGGMQRRLAIACALIKAPKVLFMDEPTVGLDPASRRQIWSALKDLKKSGVAILLTTHYLEEAELLADRIGIIRGGRLVAEGTQFELAKKIHGMRGISIRLGAPDAGGEQSTAIDNLAALKTKLDALSSQLGVSVQLDELRHTVYISQPEGAELDIYLRTVFEWLRRENISFSKFATGEPNLEEVFLALAKGES